VDRCLKAKSVAVEAERIFNEDVALCRNIGKHGAELIEDGSNVMTICNAGALATVGIGTALGVFTAAKKQGKKFHVFVPETRPLLQGARLTAWELSRLGITFTLICDNMMGIVLSRKNIKTIVVGADRIAANGDFANKIGTYGLAVLAKHHSVPFYVAAPHTTVDPKTPDGASIPIETRHAGEVIGTAGLATADVYNPAFDVTPADLVSGWILDSGVKTKKDFDQ
jgi:methylthioribose-1-phosphate isomerase